MNNMAFIQKVMESFKEQICFDYTGVKVVLTLNGESWMGDTIDQCIVGMKETFAIRYLDQLESENQINK